MPVPPAWEAPRNPYYHISMVRDLRMFFGRRDALRRLFASIRDQQCISLVGPRRIGKSSVLGALRSQELQTRFGFTLDAHVLAYIDTAAHTLKSYEDFLEFISAQLIAQNQDRLFPLQAQPKRDVSQFRQFLEDIHALGFYPVLLLDEFENIASQPQFTSTFFFFLRAQANMGMISYITASKDTLDKVCHANLAGSPFFNIFSTLRLGALTHSEAQELALLPAQGAGIPFSPTEATWIANIAGRHPFFIQRACHFLFEAKSLHPQQTVEMDEVGQQVYTELLPHFQYAWTHVDPESQEQLAWEARREEVTKRMLPEFSESHLFRYFVREECNINLSSLTTDHLDEVLTHIDDLHMLGNSMFGYFNIVYLQANGTTLSAMERGLVVQRLILTAIEELRPNMQQTKDETQFRLYQILSLRHKEGLRNEEIAARLAISTRHFFRERTKALKALLNVLLKQEAFSKEQLRSHHQS
jgi:Novel STAND NTPase 2